MLWDNPPSGMAQNGMQWSSHSQPLSAVSHYSAVHGEHWAPKPSNNHLRMCVNKPIFFERTCTLHEAYHNRAYANDHLHPSCCAEHTNRFVHLPTPQKLEPPLKRDFFSRFSYSVATKKFTPDGVPVHCESLQSASCICLPASTIH